MSSFNGSSADVGLLSEHAWRLRTGVDSWSAQETFLPLTSKLRFVAVRSVLQGGNRVTECFLVVLQCSFSVRVEIVPLMWHSIQASSILSICCLTAPLALQSKHVSDHVLCVRDLYLCLALCHSTCASPAPVHRLSACGNVVRKLCGNNLKNIFPSVACFLKTNKNIKDLNLLVQTQENTLLVYELNLVIKYIFFQIIMWTLLICISLSRLYYTIWTSIPT